MKRIAIVVFGLLLLSSCNKKSNKSMLVNGEIKGLEKGIIYLQKKVDSLLVSVDSVAVNGTNKFVLSDDIETPEIYYVTLKNTNKIIPFFGEEGTIYIYSKLDRFEMKAEISGSKNQELLEKYKSFKTKFSNQNLDLIKANFEAKISGNKDSALIAQEKIKKLEIKRYLYTTNFAINNADSEVAPYIALTELNNAALKLLDTINNSLSEKVKKSKYGKQLHTFVVAIKENEKQ